MTPRLLIAAASMAMSAAMPVVAHASPVIVNISAQSAAGTTLTLDAGTYTLNWVGTAGGGAYNAWQYNTAKSGNFREAFTISFGGAGYTYDRGTSGAYYTNYVSAAVALAEFEGAAGNNRFVEFSNLTGTGTSVALAGLPSFTLTSQTNVTFGVPDALLSDNNGGVSLALNRADVPEPQSLALVLAALGGLCITRRRKPAAQAQG